MIFIMKKQVLASAFFFLVSCLLILSVRAMETDAGTSDQNNQEKSNKIDLDEQFPNSCPRCGTKFLQSLNEMQPGLNTKKYRTYSPICPTCTTGEREEKRQDSGQIDQTFHCLFCEQTKSISEQRFLQGEKASGFQVSTKNCCATCYANQQPRINKLNAELIDSEQEEDLEEKKEGSKQLTLTCSKCNEDYYRRILKPKSEGSEIQEVHVCPTCRAEEGVSKGEKNNKNEEGPAETAKETANENKKQSTRSGDESNSGSKDTTPTKSTISRVSRFDLQGFAWQQIVVTHMIRRMVKTGIFLSANYALNSNLFSSTVTQKVSLLSQELPWLKRLDKVRQLNLINLRWTIELLEAAIVGLAIQRGGNRFKNCCKEMATALIQEQIVWALHVLTPETIKSRAETVIAKQHWLISRTIHETQQQGVRLLVRIGLDTLIYGLTGHQMLLMKS